MNRYKYYQKVFSKGDWVWYFDHARDSRYSAGIVQRGTYQDGYLIKNLRNRIVKRPLIDCTKIFNAARVNENFYRSVEDQFSSGYVSDTLFTFDLHEIRHGELVRLSVAGDPYMMEFNGVFYASNGVLRMKLYHGGQLVSHNYNFHTKVKVATPEEVTLYLLNKE